MTEDDRQCQLNALTLTVGSKSYCHCLLDSGTEFEDTMEAWTERQQLDNNKYKMDMYFITQRFGNYIYYRKITYLTSSASVNSNTIISQEIDINTQSLSFVLDAKLIAVHTTEDNGITTVEVTTRYGSAVVKIKNNLIIEEVITTELSVSNY